MSFYEKTSQDQLKNDTCLFEKGETLHNGIWPNSKVLWMAAFYMALFIIRPWEQLFPSLAVLHPERVYAICMLVAIFLAGENKFQMTWQTMTVLFFFAAIVLSGLFAYDPSLSGNEIFKYLSLVIFYFSILLVVRTPYDLAFLVTCYIGTMCLYLAKSQWEFFVNGKHEYRMGVSRLIGIEDSFGGPNALAMSIVVSLPFAVFLWRNRTIVSRTWPITWQIRLRRGLMLYGVLAVTSIILTNSRSGMAGFIVFVLLLGFNGKGFGKKIKYCIIGTLVLTLIWAFMPEENKGRFRTIWEPEVGPANAQSSAEGRIEGYKAGMKMFQRFPFTGVGPGNFVAYRVANIDSDPLQAHNLVGQLLGELGGVGGLTFLLVLCAIVVNCRKVAQLARTLPDSVVTFLADLAMACLLSLTLLLFLGMFGHNIYRFNWLWIAGFSVLALQFATARYSLLEIEGARPE